MNSPTFHAPHLERVLRSGALLVAGVLAGVLITHGLNSAAFLQLRSDEAAVSAAIQMATRSQEGVSAEGTSAIAQTPVASPSEPPSAPPQGVPSKSVRLRVTANGLTLRQAPRPDGTRITSLPLGTLLIAEDGFDDSGWVAVSTNGTVGWVSRQWVEPEREHAAMPTRQQPPAKTTPPPQIITRSATIRDPLPPVTSPAQPPETVPSAQMLAAVQPPSSPSQVNTTFEQAGIAGIDSSGIHFRSGRRVAIGEPFPSGEKLLSIDPRNARIVTDRRVINIKVQLPSSSPTSP
ncbi:SH3 domain-containing protein [Hydrogenophaga aromaticivorans]|uniref:SH3 domain-containing protein n=1 Tax=Hydrogenophaga aromaticivorans TaxID=2610898 RepID=UPI001B36FDE1|nr:SH3 domain-containing protein [Hydrogenophaga aromaticivorans]MBQ0916974.1 SH3 domain-containing protein [Hydrogenophaga aromaticivorans]